MLCDNRFTICYIFLNIFHAFTANSQKKVLQLRNFVHMVGTL